MSVDHKPKPDGWHSRRHETREAQDAAREAYQTRAEGRPRQMWDEALKCWRIKVLA